MNNLMTRLGLLAIILVILLAVGTVGFMVLESLSILDAFYFTVITVATVGYGDISPVTFGGRMLSIFIIITGVGTFTALLVNTSGLFLERRANRRRIERTNILIGLFYSVIGNRLLELCLNADPSINTIRDKTLIQIEWTEGEFHQLLKHMQRYEYDTDIEKVDFSQLKILMHDHTNLLISLLENPSLIENELFTELLRAVFHLREELMLREDIKACSKDDLIHLGNDVKRVYSMLSTLWFRYVHSLKRRYPYLFSLVVRNNPFNETRCVSIK
ncbi:potassium channel family protein [Chloroflexota bacterium]